MQIVLAALVAVASAGIPHYGVGYGFIAAGHGHGGYGYGHGGFGGVAKVNAVQTGHNYAFNVRFCSMITKITHLLMKWDFESISY
jgi:hypothetical protein